jgi:phosphoribosyl 1,2-cyclic phosphodiesterase
MIDAGITLKTLKDAINISDIKVVLMTHIHSDHFKSALIRSLFAQTDCIFYVGEFLVKEIKKVGVEDDRIIICEAGNIYKFGDYNFCPVILFHDVPNFGWRIKKGNYLHFHATDTFTLDGIEAIGYQSASIECNHHYETALELIEKAKEDGEFSHLQGALNSHLSVQKTIDFCKENKIGQLYPVHIGSSTKKQVIKALRAW